MTSIAGAIPKVESVFDTLILPGLSIAAGYFSGPILFAPLEAKIGSIDANGDGVSDLDHAFGPDYNGSRIIGGLIVGVIGFSVYKMGSFFRYLGFYLIGAAIGMIANGFKLVGGA